VKQSETNTSLTDVSFGIPSNMDCFNGHKLYQVISTSPSVRVIQTVKLF